MKDETRYSVWNTFTDEEFEVTETELENLLASPMWNDRVMMYEEIEN